MKPKKGTQQSKSILIEIDRSTDSIIHRTGRIPYFPFTHAHSASF